MDLRIIMRRCLRQVSGEECKAALGFLEEKGFRLLLASANRAYFHALGVDNSNLQGTRIGSGDYAVGDLITSEDWSEVVYLGQRTSTQRQPGTKPSLAAIILKESRLELGSISTVGTNNLFEPIRLAICEGLGIGASVPWETLAWKNQAFEDLKSRATSKTPVFSRDEASAATALCELPLRKLCRSVKTAGSLLVKELPKIEGNVDDSSRLRALGLVTEQHVLICRKTSGMVFQLETVENLAEIDNKGVKCAFCGRKPSEERFEQLLVPTDLCRALLDHSRWMASVLVTVLAGLGVTSDSLLLEFQEGSEEVDAFVDIEGDLVMIELKDKEFSMAQAHSLSAHIGLFHPKYAVIVTADKVAPEVKEFFSQLKPETVLTYIEGLQSLDLELQTLVNKIRAKSAARILENFKPLTMNAEIASLICAKMGIESPKATASLVPTIGSIWPSIYFSGTGSDTDN